MKRFAIFFLTILMLVLLIACDDTCKHRDADDDSLCDKCEENYTDGIDVDTKKCMHQYASLATCVDRACTTNGCEHIEVATTEHEYTKEYVCKNCKAAKSCTLEVMGEDFHDEIMAQARKNAGILTGDFEVVVLGKEETMLHLQKYIISENFDETKLVGGLFVKFNIDFFGEPYTTVYYNFGLQFSDEQLSDVTFTHPDVEEEWLLEVVEGNKTILFEYSIT